jgi:hypothetical protein
MTMATVPKMTASASVEEPKARAVVRTVVVGIGVIVVRIVSAAVQAAMSATMIPPTAPIRRFFDHRPLSGGSPEIAHHPTRWRGLDI